MSSATAQAFDIPSNTHVIVIDDSRMQRLVLQQQWAAVGLPAHRLQVSAPVRPFLYLINERPTRISLAIPSHLLSTPPLSLSFSPAPPLPPSLQVWGQNEIEVRSFVDSVAARALPCLPEPRAFPASSSPCPRALPLLPRQLMPFLVSRNFLAPLRLPLANRGSDSRAMAGTALP